MLFHSLSLFLSKFVFNVLKLDIIICLVLILE